uniref:Protein kinase domain-containing protein n=1 Tax=Ananas comosus var. bracteatus TaxID=296719 RepID=A0A6V7QIJ6_ANACO|nr:unnamed protein product [Ananas comosus var. bracteatus]
MRNKNVRILAISTIVLLLFVTLILFLSTRGSKAFFLVGSCDATFIFVILVWAFVQDFLVPREFIGSREVNIIAWITVVPLLALVVLLCVRVKSSTIFYVTSSLDVAAFFLYGLTAAIPRIMAWQRRDAGNSELDLEEERHLGYSFLGEVVGLPKRIPYRELKEATRNFQTPIGRGGSGSVFKGILGDGLPVAVKRIEGELRGEREFRSEITAILSVQHVSLVRIVGYCIIPRSYRFLVYEYFENGSLDNWIFPKAGRENNCLNWALRYQVAIDVAKALAYLHHQCRQRILHLDVKPENILVDENFRAHVTDFGISRLLGVDETSVITTVRGTRGYLAPEWFAGGGICEKSDVYGYGMVLFELMSGRRNINFVDEGGHISQRRWSYFPKNASEKMKGGNLMELVDQRLIGSGDVKEEEVKTLVYVAFWCIQDKPELRRVWRW